MTFLSLRSASPRQCRGCPIAFLYTLIALLVGGVTLVVVALITINRVETWWTPVMESFVDAAALKAETKIQRYLSILRNGCIVMQTAANLSSTCKFNGSNTTAEFVDTLFGTLAVSASAYTLFSTESTVDVFHFNNSSCLAFEAPKPTTFVMGPSVALLSELTPFVESLFGTIHSSCEQQPGALVATCNSTMSQTIAPDFVSLNNMWFPPTRSMIATARSAFVGFCGQARVTEEYREPLCGATVTRSVTGALCMVDFGLGFSAVLDDFQFTPNSRFVIVDVITGSIVASSDPTDASGGSDTPLPLVNESHDDIIRAVVRVVDLDALRQCHGVPSCSWYLSSSSGGAEYHASSPVPLLTVSTTEVLLVRVVPIRDSNGLDIRVVVMIPASDFISHLRDGVRNGMAYGFAALAVLVALCASLAHIALQPIRDAAHSLSTCLQSALRIRASLPMEQFLETFEVRHRCCRIEIAEVAGLLRACRRLWADVNVLMSFLPLRGGQEEDGSGFDSYEDSQLTLIPAAAVQTATSRQSTPVTFVVLNMSGTHSMRRTMLPSDFAGTLSRYLTIVMTQATKHGGVVGSFYGDHVFVHFNAQQRVRRHAAAACRMMLDVARDVHDAGSALHPVAMAASTGPALSLMMGGNTTASSLRGFHVIGPCVGDALRMSYFASCIIEGESRQGTHRSVSLVCQRTEKLVTVSPVSVHDDDSANQLLFLNCLIVEPSTSVSGYPEVVSELLAAPHAEVFAPAAQEDSLRGGILTPSLIESVRAANEHFQQHHIIMSFDSHPTAHTPN